MFGSRVTSVSLHNNRLSGSIPPELDDLHYETFDDNVDLHGGALVRQRIQYRRLRIGPGNHSAWIMVGGGWNDHFLE